MNNQVQVRTISFGPICFPAAIYSPGGKNKVPLLTVRTEKTRLLRHILYLWVQIERKDFKLTKPINLAGCEMYHGPLN